MSFIDAGAYVNGVRPKTKKALREALTQDPTSVRFDGTSAFTPFAGDITQLSPGETLIIVGPDPYRARNWYANVTRSASGAIKVA